MMLGSYYPVGKIKTMPPMQELMLFGTYYATNREKHRDNGFFFPEGIVLSKPSCDAFPILRITTAALS